MLYICFPCEVKKDFEVGRQDIAYFFCYIFPEDEVTEIDT